MWCSAVMTVKMQCNMMKTSKTGILLSVPSLLDRPLQGGGYGYRFLLKINMSIFTCTSYMSLCASTYLIQAVRFVERVEIKARPVAAKVLELLSSRPDE